LNPQRIEWLDGARGFAALAVAVCHLLGTQDEAWVRTLLSYTNYPILNIFWNGSAAVALFFVLSGYVLTLGMQRGDCANPRWLVRYWVGRVSRIAFPFWGAMLLSLCLIEYFYDSQVLQAVANTWFVSMWDSGEGLYQQLMKQAALILPATEHVLIPQGWTLTVELQVSLLLPLIFLGFVKRLWMTVLVALCVGVLLRQTFVVHFLLGMLLAVYQIPIADYMQKLSTHTKWLLFAVGLILLTSVWQPAGKVGEIAYWCINGFGSAVVIAVGGTLVGVMRFFESRLLSFLGKISYSLYLTHMIVYLIILSYVTVSMSIMTLGLSLLASVFVAVIFYHWVELPSIKAGHYLKKQV